MRSLKSHLRPNPEQATSVIDPRLTSRRILTEYILNMAVSALARGDLAPLYDHYMDDPRLSEDDRDELARAYLLLQMTATQAPGMA